MLSANTDGTADLVAADKLQVTREEGKEKFRKIARGICSIKCPWGRPALVIMRAWSIH